MRSLLITLHAVVLAIALPSLAYGQSGTEVSAGEPGNLHRPSPAAAMTPKVAIQQGPYNMGQAIFNGTYRFKKPASTHVAEKNKRLSLLAGGLPAADRQKFDPKTLSNELSDREANALEYYIQVKYGKYVDIPPSWAKKEPPIKVSNK
ncbi:MAG TPA: hypothetical protein VGI60_06060 [Chthoniobacterales bacterium]|jgi:hypothetical protein